MSTLVHDTTTLTGRNLRHAIRYPSALGYTLGMPIMMLIGLNAIFGRSLGSALGISGNYLDYLVPGLLVITAGIGSVMTAVHVAGDDTGGMMSRLRTLPLARLSLLAAPAIGTMLQAVASTLLFLLAALILGFRPQAGLWGWLGGIGLCALLSLALSWLAIAIGLSSPNAEAASNNAGILMYLPFVSSAFVPAAGMAPGLREFARFQPFTPIVETLRALFGGHQVGGQGWIALAWVIGLTLVGVVWSRHVFEKRR